MKERLKKKYTRRLRMILKSELNTKNKITAIETLSVPVLRYSSGIIINDKNLQENSRNTTNE
jgi:hypothetical protein